jgi:signal transduction histidine kinase
LPENLKMWLRQQSAAICLSTFSRMPPVVPNEDDVFQFISMLATNIADIPERQLSAIQGWALMNIGHDARGAYDWLVVLRILKDEILNQLEQQFTPQEVLKAWKNVDSMLTQAIIEASQLATDFHRADLVEHMLQLRNEQEAFESSKTKFISIAAHELKTPLTILEGYANILRVETAENPQLQIYVQGLGNGFRRMHEIISDMLDVSLLELKNLDLKFQEVHIEKLVQMVAEHARKYYAERSVELIVEPFYMNSVTYGDPEKLKKVFDKILMNGLKYTPDGNQVLVTATAIRQDESDDEKAGFIDIQVIDSGIGIDPDDLESIFTHFGSLADASLHSSSKTKFKGGGPGLGLPIARGIVEAHGGRVWAESEGFNEALCRGSTFHVELPLWLHPPGE